MAAITRGPQDNTVLRIRDALNDYERHHPGAVASVYRQNSASIRIRIVDERFSGQSKGQRHDDAWRFIADQLDSDTSEEVSMLILLAPSEQRSSFINTEFDDPLPSRI